jgi:hypothetical protein
MLLALASAVLLGSESLGIRDHILLSQILRLPFSSPSTTRRVTVEVFDRLLAVEIHLFKQIYPDQI